LCCFTSQSHHYWDIWSHFSSNTPFWTRKIIVIGLYSSYTMITMLYCIQNDPLQMILCRFTSQSFNQWDIWPHFSTNTPNSLSKTIAIWLYSSYTMITMLYCIQNDPLQMILCRFTSQSFLHWDILSHFSSNTPNQTQKSIVIGLYSCITIITMLYCTENGQLQIILSHLYTCAYIETTIKYNNSCIYSFSTNPKQPIV